MGTRCWRAPLLYRPDVAIVNLGVCRVSRNTCYHRCFRAIEAQLRGADQLTYLNRSSYSVLDNRWPRVRLDSYSSRQIFACQAKRQQSFSGGTSLIPAVTPNSESREPCSRPPEWTSGVGDGYYSD